MNEIIDALHEGKKLRLIATVLELLQYEKADSADIPIPGTLPQRYIAIGTAATAAKLLEIDQDGEIRAGLADDSRFGQMMQEYLMGQTTVEQVAARLEEWRSSSGHLVGGGPDIAIKTWRERIGAKGDFPLHAPTDVERAMVAEIAELRAARYSKLSLEQTIELMLAAGFPDSDCRSSYAGHGLTVQLEHLRDFANAARVALPAAAQEAEHVDHPEGARDVVDWKANAECLLDEVKQLRQVIAAAAIGGALVDVLAERRRQVEKEGWTPEHDDRHSSGDLSTAAGCYALFSDAYPNAGQPPEQWPWVREWWKPKDYRRDIVRAAALLLAEIERLDRKAERRELAQGQKSATGERK